MKPTMPPDKHRALSIRQPYSEQILRRTKKIEYRSFPTKIRGMVYLYASKTCDREMIEAVGLDPDKLDFGLIVGTVEIVDCVDNGGEYEWHLDNPKRFKVPLKSKKHAQPSFWFAF